MSKAQSLPQNIPAEQAVLGAMLIDPDALDVAVERLHPGAFSRQRHAVIFRALAKLSATGEPLDQLTLIECLKREGSLDAVGGASYILELISAVVTTAHIEQYVELVEGAALQRWLIRRGQELVEDVYSGRDARELLDELERDVFAERSDNIRGDLEHISSDASLVVDNALSERDSSERVSTGIPDLDELTTGFGPAEVIVIAGRTSSGKTALALNIAQKVAEQSAVGLFSLEMSRSQLILRLISSASGVSSNKIRANRCGRADISRITNALPQVSKLALFIDDTPAQSLTDMLAKARRLARRQERSKFPLRLVVIDYLQLVKPFAGAQTREQEVAGISKAAKVLSREIGVPVLLLSQLNRQADMRGRPRLSDLRESGAIEQDADMVLFVHRPELLGQKSVKVRGKTLPSKGLAELIVAKQRSGPLGSVWTVFDGRTTTFEQLAYNANEEFQEEEDKWTQETT